MFLEPIVRGGKEALLHAWGVVEVIRCAFENYERFGLIGALKVLLASSHKHTPFCCDDLERNAERRRTRVPFKGIDFLRHLFSDNNIHPPAHEVPVQRLHKRPSRRAVRFLGDADVIIT